MREDLINIYLDDVRVSPCGFVKVETVNECIRLLSRGNCNILSLDHDLGYTDPENTGYDVLIWLEGQVYENPNFKIPKKINIHSANYGAVPRMRAAVEQVYKMAARAEDIFLSRMISKDEGPEL